MDEVLEFLLIPVVGGRDERFDGPSGSAPTQEHRVTEEPAAKEDDSRAATEHEVPAGYPVTTLLLRTAGVATLRGAPGLLMAASLRLPASRLTASLLGLPALWLATSPLPATTLLGLASLWLASSLLPASALLGLSLAWLATLGLTAALLSATALLGLATLGLTAALLSATALLGLATLGLTACILVTGVTLDACLLVEASPATLATHVGE